MCTHEKNVSFLRKKGPICDRSQSNKMPYTDQITEIDLTHAPISQLLSNISTMGYLKLVKLVKLRKNIGQSNINITKSIIISKYFSLR